MIKETFIALKSIGVEDQKILDVIEAFENRHQEFRREITDMKRDIAILKWSMPLIVGLLVTLLFKVFSN